MTSHPLPLPPVCPAVIQAQKLNTVVEDRLSAEE